MIEQKGFYSNLVESQKFQNIKIIDTKKNNINTEENSESLKNNYDSNIFAKNNSILKSFNENNILNKNFNKKWNIFYIYQNAKGNYVKLFLAILCSILRGQELVLYIYLMKLLFDAFQNYEITKDYNFFIKNQNLLLFLNTATGIYCFVFIFLSVCCILFFLFFFLI